MFFLDFLFGGGAVVVNKNGFVASEKGVQNYGFIIRLNPEADGLNIFLKANSFGQQAFQKNSSDKFKRF